MHVLDSSVWIYAITRTCDEAVDLVDRAVRGELPIAVDGYIFNEVVAGIERSGNDFETISDAQTRFSEIIHRSSAIHAPTQNDVETTDLDTVRSDARVQLLGLTWGIQPKDVPIVELAFQQPAEPAIVFTSDESFSEFDPKEFGIDTVALQYVPCP